MSINNITLSGNLGRDAEVRETKDHVLVTRFTIAYPMRKRDGDGTWVDETGWIDAVIFGVRGEKLSAYLTKGCPVTVSGRLNYSTFIGQDSVRRTTHEVVIEEIAFGSRKPKADSGEDGLAKEDFAF